VYEKFRETCYFLNSHNNNKRISSAVCPYLQSLATRFSRSKILFKGSIPYENHWHISTLSFHGVLQIRRFGLASSCVNTATSHQYSVWSSLASRVSRSIASPLMASILLFASFLLSRRLFTLILTVLLRFVPRNMVSFIDYSFWAIKVMCLASLPYIMVTFYIFLTTKETKLLKLALFSIYFLFFDNGIYCMSDVTMPILSNDLSKTLCTSFCFKSIDSHWRNFIMSCLFVVLQVVFWVTEAGVLLHISIFDSTWPHGSHFVTGNCCLMKTKLKLRLHTEFLSLHYNR